MTNLTGRTITIEEIGQVPELDRAPRGGDYDWRIIERRDGVFVRAHPNGPLHNPMWDNARHIADRLDARYVGPGREETLPAGEIREGWHVQLGSYPRQSWNRVERVTALVCLDKRPGGRPRPRVRVEFEGRAPLTVAACARLRCRPLAGS